MKGSDNLLPIRVKGQCIWCNTPTIFTLGEYNSETYYVCLKCFFWRIPNAVLGSIIKGIIYKL